jgi:hypothetical protein
MNKLNIKNENHGLWVTCWGKGEYLNYEPIGYWKRYFSFKPVEEIEFWL